MNVFIKIQKIFIILIILQGILSKYPEDYSTIERLTYPENQDNNDIDEIFLGCYYQGLTPSEVKDIRNGILIQSKDFGQSESNCGNPTSYSGDDDQNWGYSEYNNIFYPPSLALITSNCINGNNIQLNLQSLS